LTARKKGNRAGKRAASTQPGRTQVKIEHYKNHEIQVFLQEPSITPPETDEEWERASEPDVLGTHGYRVLDSAGKTVFFDDAAMWDEGACLDNARADVDFLDDE
jgi:hypothetical protein